ncbi:hypothetical protein JTT01_13815 [Clostridium botulinum]|nr:hypothetical protein [Clostridium botulinum]MCS4516040.1 hypothetical protein [Clostridium botulinum]
MKKSRQICFVCVIFPQLVAGPIEKSKDLLNQFNENIYLIIIE